MMIILKNVLKSIKNDFLKPEYENRQILSRKYAFNNKVSCVIYYNNILHTCEVGFSFKSENNIINKFPKWKGINYKISLVEDINCEENYIIFQQLEDYDIKIFITVMQDLIDNISMCKNLNDIPKIIIKILVKWKRFFSINNQVVLSEANQQGLYGELVFLLNLIEAYGERSLLFWTGYNSETHDFYVYKNAVEIKTTSSEYNIATISNKYQLDTNDVIGNLYLMFISLKKSLVDGETIPDIINKILNKISDDELRENFEEMLFKYGYINSSADLYTHRFRIREVIYYDIEDGFPRITKDLISNKIVNVTYKLDLNGCEDFIIQENDFIRKLKE